jgi:hypothetical protein
VRFAAQNEPSDKRQRALSQTQRPFRDNDLATRKKLTFEDRVPRRRRKVTMKSIETKYMEERESLLRSLRDLDRRSFFKLSAAAGACAMTHGVAFPHSFQPVRIVQRAVESFRIAYISDSHLYERKLNDRFVKRCCAPSTT